MSHRVSRIAPVWVVLLIGGILIGAGTAEARSGAVVTAGKRIMWGQYRSLRGVIGVESNTGHAGLAPLSASIKHYPISGAQAALLYCQRPGQRFFSADGATIDAAALEQLRADVDAVYRFDMLPVIVLFDPAPECRLDGPAAYAAATDALMDALMADYWFLLCVTDQADAPAWEQGDAPGCPVAICTEAVKAAQARDKKQPVAAGGADADLNEALLDDEVGIAAIVARTPKLGTLIDAGPRPVIEVVPASTAAGSALDEAVARVFDDYVYGFAVCLDGAAEGQGEAARAAFLQRLFHAVDRYEKTAFPSAPYEGDPAAGLKPGEAEEGFVSLFNGNDLSGWVQLTMAEGGFVVEDGVIRLAKKSGGWLRSWRPYADFVFRAEYRIEEGGNSGIYIRSPLAGRSSRVGFEFQVFGDPADKTPDKNSSGSIYDVRPPDKHCMKPGAWNEVEITCQGTAVTIVWNGEVVHDVCYEEIDFMKQRATWGYIGLQDHRSFVEFRNLRIKPLSPPPAAWTEE